MLARDCGLFENGFARVRCLDCRAEYLLAFSCKTRDLCPPCAARRSAVTAALLRDDVLEEVGHAQWVFVMPKMLRLYFLHHRELLGGLARAAWETVLELMVAATGEETLRPGMVAVVQTAGELARWHPHVHVLVSRGGWTRGWEWVPIGYVDEHAAELLYRHKVIRLLQGEGLLSEERTRLLLSWRHTGLRRRFAACDPPWPAGGRRPPLSLSGPACAGPATPSATATRRCPAACVSVHTRVRVEPEDGTAVERLARYIMRPLSLTRRPWRRCMSTCSFRFPNPAASTCCNLHAPSVTSVGTTRKEKPSVSMIGPPA